MLKPHAELEIPNRWWNLLERSGLWGARLRLPILLFAATMAAFSLQRLIILLTMWPRFFDVSARDILQGFGLALRFDAVVGWIAILPLLIALAAAPDRTLTSRWFGWLIGGYGGFCASLLLFICVADYFFFQEFGLRLNYLVLEYAGYSAVYRTIWQQYPVLWAMLAALAVLLGSTWLLRRVGWSRDREPTQFRQRMVALSLIPLAVIGIRGSLGNRPMDSGLVYFCPSPTLSQLSLNGCFTLKEAMVSRSKERGLAEFYPLMNEDEALRLAKDLIARPQDRFLDDLDNPLRRITDTGRPRRDYNVVLVVLESMAWPYIGALDGDQRLMPNLSAIAESGILMDHCFAVGHRTAQGLTGTLAGFPDLPGRSVMTRPETEGCFFTIASVLRKRGYETVFMQGGQPYFDHKKAFCASNGYSRTIFEREMPRKTFRTVVGWCDEDVFDSVDEVARGMGDRPFLISMLTISFHRPFQIPPGKIQPVDPGNPRADQLDAIRYTDRAIGKLFEKARQSKYFDNTIFVFTADHIGGFRQDPVVPGISFRLPFIIYAPSIVGPARRVHTVCSQTDISPTVLSLLGGSYENCFFGSSVLDRPADSGMAVMRTGDDQLILVDGQRNVLLMPPHDGERRLYQLTIPDRLDLRSPTDPAATAHARQLQTDAMALLQSAEILFRRHSYHLRPTPPAENETTRR